jgi:hypothetical protein
MQASETSLRQAKAKYKNARRADSSRFAGHKAVREDPALPQLAIALDPQKMRAAFEEHFRREYPERGVTVDQVYVGKSYHKPGRGCDVNYGVNCRDRENKAHYLLLHGKIFADGESHRKSVETMPASWPGCGFWKPVSFWAEMRMLITAFPYDPDLPNLGLLMEPEFVKRQVEENLAGFGLPAGWKCLEVNCQNLKYRPGKRCILRYEILAAGPAGEQRRLIFYGKTYDNARSRYVYEILQNIFASPVCAGGRLNIPQPIAHIDEANTIWSHAWEGTNLSQVVGELGWAKLPEAGYVPKIAAMLAALHQVEMPGLQLSPVPSLWMALKNACGDASDIASFLPEKQQELENITTSLEAVAAELESDLPTATIHGSFKVAQILCREQELALLDFDSIARGDPLFDVAELLASFIYLRVSDDIPAAPIAESVEIFLANYSEQVPWPFDRRRLAWYLVGFLLGKMHASLKRSEPSAMANMPLAFEIIRGWLEFVVPPSGVARWN